MHQVPNPTFVTISVSDFWLTFQPHKNYCIIGIMLLGSQSQHVPNILCNLFRLPPFRTKAARMGKIIRVRPSGIDYYMTDRKIHFLPWST